MMVRQGRLGRANQVLPLQDLPKLLRVRRWVEDQDAYITAGNHAPLSLRALQTGLICPGLVEGHTPVTASFEI